MSGRPAVEPGVTERLASLIRAEYVPDSPTHDHWHLERVAGLAERICAAEGGDQFIAISAAWLHDLHRENRSSGEFFVPPEDMDQRAEQLLLYAGVPVQLHAQILAAIHYTDHYSFSDRPTYRTSIEARAVRDADSLDAIGAIGVARAFTFGGRHGIPLWTGAVADDRGTYVHSRRPESTIHHFYEKLLRLPAELETRTARKLAERRIRLMEQFVDEFAREWRDDLAPDSLASGMLAHEMD
jgi:uncharacterized protein